MRTLVAVNEELHEAEQVTPSGLPGPRGAACPRAADSPPAHYPHPETSVGGPAFPPEGRGGIKHPGFTPVCSQGYRGGQRAHPTCCDPLLGAMLSKRSPRCPPLGYLWVTLYRILLCSHKPHVSRVFYRCHWEGFQAVALVHLEHSPCILSSTCLCDTHWPGSFWGPRLEPGLRS